MSPKGPVGSQCPTCKMTVVLHDFHGMEPFKGCSDFCATTSEEEKEAFRNAKLDEWRVYPCAICGCAVEGEWYPDEPRKTTCSECAPKVRLAMRTAMLAKSKGYLDMFEDSCENQVLRQEIEDLIAEINDALDY